MDQKVALFRAIKGWIVQFGVSGDPSLTKRWRQRGSIPVQYQLLLSVFLTSVPQLPLSHTKDDPQWLPKGAKRFKRGLISFAGSGVF